MLSEGYTNGADCEKTTFHLGSQQDVDALRDCPTLTGDVVIAATAEGSIDLDGIETIIGTLSNEECFEGANDNESVQALLNGDLENWQNCRGLESLSSETLSHITGDVTLQSLVDIAEVKLNNLEGVNGTLVIEFLPHLERANFSSLELAESIFIRHSRQLTNLTMSKLNNVTAEESTIELVDLGIYQWPRINIRIQRPDEQPPRRRLERLLVRDLPNISLFELNNADEFGLLEVHGFANQTAQLTTEYSEVGPLPGWRFTEPVAAVDNFTLSGFGGQFNIALLLTDPKSTIDIAHVRMVNTNFTNIGLSNLGSPQSLYVADNPELEAFSMPGDIKTAKWDAIEFDNNPRLFFGEKELDAPQLIGWYWGMNTSVLSIKGSPMEADFTDYMCVLALIYPLRRLFVVLSPETGQVA